MLIEESIKLKDYLDKYLRPGDLVLNIGAQSEHYRTVLQPYIQANIFNTLSSMGCKVLNVDLKRVEGVDYVGDLLDTDFVNSLKTLNPGAILCNNILEHVLDREKFCSNVEKIMRKNSCLIVSVPKKFPYHPDPLDTMFRPSLKVLQDMFENLEFLDGEEVYCNKVRFQSKYKVIRGRVLTLPAAVRSFIKNKNFKSVKNVILERWSDIFMKNFNVTCAVLSKGEIER